MALRILISESEPNDTQALIRGLGGYGEVEVVGIARDGLECAAMANYLAPDVALVRETMAALNGYRACQLIAQTSPRTLSVLVMDSFSRADPACWPVLECGARAAIGLDTSPVAVVELLQRLTQGRPSPEDWEYRVITDPTRLPITIAVSGSKGGIGKTTTAVNLSLALQQKHMGQVVLVDFVGQYGDVCVMLNLTPQKSILDVAAQEDLDETVLKSMVTQHPSGLHVLAGVNSASTLGAIDQLSLVKVARLLGVLRRMYRVIVMDIPALAHPLSGYIYQRSDHICLMTSLADLTAVRSTAALLQSLLGDHVPSDRIKLVVSRYNPQDDYTVEQLEQSLHHRVAVKIPWAKEAISTAANLGQPYVLAKPNSPPAVAITQLANLLAAEARTLGAPNVVPTERAEVALR